MNNELYPSEHSSPLSPIEDGYLDQSGNLTRRALPGPHKDYNGDMFSFMKNELIQAARQWNLVP